MRLRCTSVNKQDSSLRVATLLSCIGSDVLDIFDGLTDYRLTQRPTDRT